MLFWLGIVVAFILVAVVANAVVFYVLYRLSPERNWRERVERRMADAQNRLRAERRELGEASVTLGKEESALRRRAFDTFLKSFSVAELEAYPGIGPGTVSKLRSAGFSDLATLQDARIRVYGLGAKRLADIQNAVRTLVKQASSRFEAGACREAQDLGPQLEEVRGKHAQRKHLLRARLAGTEAVIAKMRPLLENARKVTFFRYLRRESDPAIPDELLNAPLPDLEGTVQVADNRAAAANASRSKLCVANRQTVANGMQVQPNLNPGDLPSGPTSAVGISEPREPLDLARLEATVEFAFAVARADGRIARKEKEVIEQHLRTRFGEDLALLNRARAFSAHYESAAIDLTRCLHQITNLFTADERRALFAFASAIADAAGKRNQREVEFLEKVADKLGILSAPQPAANAQKVAVIPPEPANRFTDSAPEPTTPEQRLALLEIDAAVPLSADLVRRQFNLLSERYAPDRFESMGSEFAAVAESKRAALVAAATALLEQWGEKLETLSSPSQPQDLRHNPDLDAMFGA